ncbi:MAG TPA: 6-pyruvoyl-tetrahydropterin synthase-related protein [Dehalococcoidia bacterium]|nr:6-pyruvoyl-tetrahydropterin synthase-related protein [Dehalococcoidia bacterium]
MSVQEHPLELLEPGRELHARPERLLAPAGLLLALLLGAGVRLAHVLPSDFPLNDGGMFFAMVRDLQYNDFRLPAYTSYNSFDIPYAYPPLPFYIAGFLDRMTPLGLLTILRFLPLVYSVLTIGAFYLLAKRLLKSSLAVSAATITFALLPRAFKWEIVGGGLTRSLGFLLAVLFLHQLWLALQEGKKQHIALAGLLLGLTALSHPEMLWFACYSAAIFALVGWRSWSSVRRLTIMAALGLAVASPWLVAVLLEHGSGPLLAAARTGDGIWLPWERNDLITLGFTEEPYLPLFGALGFIGLVVCIAERNFLLPAWLVLIFVFDPRKSDTLAMVPLAIMVSLALGTLGLLPGDLVLRAYRSLVRQLAAPARPLQVASAVSLLLPTVLVIALIADHQAAADFATNPAVKWTNILAVGIAFPWMVALGRAYDADYGGPVLQRYLKADLLLPLFIAPIIVWEMFDASFLRAAVNVLILASLLPLALLTLLLIRSHMVNHLQQWLFPRSRKVTYHLLAPLGLVLLLAYGIVSATLGPGSDSPPLRALPEGSRQAMAWVEASTPADARFMVITGRYGWWGDAESEWFPQLAGRQSVGTVQGFEWLHETSFNERIAQYNSLQSCAYQTTFCLDLWSFATKLQPSYVYIADPAASATNECCWALRYSLEHSDEYSLVYDTNGVAIFQRLGA